MENHNMDVYVCVSFRGVATVHLFPLRALDARCKMQDGQKGVVGGGCCCTVLKQYCRGSEDLACGE